jgi:integrase
VASTKTEALRLLREMRKELEQHGAPADQRRSMVDAVEDFWRTRQGADRSAGTFERDRWMLDVIVEGLGPKRVASLSVGDCDDFLVRLATGMERPDGSNRRPFVRQHVSRTRSMLKRVLNNEIRLGLLARNVADLAELPETPATSRPHRILTPSELADFLAACTGAFLVFADLMGRNALRPQEARALQWSAVDWEAGTLEVGPQMNRENVIVGPKTRRAPRTIQIDSTTVGLLEAWRHTQLATRSHAGELWSFEYDLVVTTRVGTSLGSRNIARSVAQVANRVGIEASIEGLRPPVVPYDLRHTAITLQSKRGYSDWELADWAGTSERMINEVYRHRTDRVVAVMPVDLGL